MLNGVLQHIAIFRQILYNENSSNHPERKRIMNPELFPHSALYRRIYRFFPLEQTG